LNYESNSF